MTAATTERRSLIPTSSARRISNSGSRSDSLINGCSEVDELMIDVPSASSSAQADVWNVSATI